MDPLFSGGFQPVLLQALVFFRSQRQWHGGGEEEEEANQRGTHHVPSALQLVQLGRLGLWLKHK